MTEKDIYNKLCEKGFDDKTSSILAENLKNISQDLFPLLEKWLEDGSETDYCSHGQSIKHLMSERKMQYQAALLTMDWILEDPETAIEALKKGIR